MPNHVIIAGGLTRFNKSLTAVCHIIGWLFEKKLDKIRKNEKWKNW